MKHVVLTSLIALTAAFAAPAFAGPNGCPPGLAKKSPACVPPGLAKKGVGRDDRDGERHRYTERHRHEERDRYGDRGRDRDFLILGADGRIYRVGERLDPRDYVLVRRDRYDRLPPLRDGHVYVQADDKVVEVIRATNLIVRTLGAVSDLLY